ncbi:MAG TPA: ABC transporter substrate-binding protein [Beijerinckiaceae bacterium]|nr:ABC transporter substrate-binding protein [Beijerinckiaceae bacterium]
MRRRTFIAAFVGAAAHPLSAAGQSAPLPVVGFVNGASPGAFAHLAASFQKGLQEEGFTDGRNVTIDARWAEGRYERLPAFLQEFVARKVAVVALTGGAMPHLTDNPATAKVPIIFVMGGDPVRAGLVASLNQPGGNVSGITQLTNELAAKRLGLLHELVPRMNKVGILINPDFPDSGPQLRELENAIARAGLSAVVVRAQAEADFDAAFLRLEQERPDALLIGADPFFNSRRSQLVALVMRLRIPTIYEFREFAEAGGLISYGTDLADAYRLTGRYVGRVLKGTKPGDLPVIQAAKFELIINLKTANALGLDIPPTLLARADEVIE